MRLKEPIPLPPDSEFRFCQTLSDAGLAELRHLAVSMISEWGKFGAWLHGWCDVEQARRARGENCCTARHGFATPNATDWTGQELAVGIEAAVYAAAQAKDITLDEFCRRIVSALTDEAGQRILQEG
jgi:hypothetical protein